MDADRAVDQVPSNLGTDYATNTAARSQNTDVADMERWAASPSVQVAGQTITPQAPGAVPDTAPRPLPQPKPLRRATEDTVGRIPTAASDVGGSVMRNVAEIPGQAVAGVDAAMHNAVGWAIDPLANWLNTHVADLSYSHDAPRTPTGAVTKDLSEFLTGFIPILKGFRALGMGGKVIAPALAGAVTSFAVQDPAEGRLSDVWVKAGLPKNALTDYLSHPMGDPSSPQEGQIEGRFKNAVENGFTGLAAEGILLSARAIRAAKSFRGVAADETSYLKGKYGEVTDADINKVVGDPKLPAIETVQDTPLKKVVQDPNDPRKTILVDDPEAKVAQGAIDTENLAPRALIRSKSSTVAPGGMKQASINQNDFDVLDFQSKTAKIGEAAGPDNVKVEKVYPQELYATQKAKYSKGMGSDEGPVVQGFEDKPVVARDPNGTMYVVDGHHRLNAADGKPVDAYVIDVPDKFPDKPRPAAVQSQDFSTYINFAKFDEPDQVKFVLGKMAEAAQGTIDEARRGVITNQETRKLASDMGMSVEDLLSRQKGQPFNAEQAVAARQLWAASAERLLETAKTAASKNAGPLDQFAFRKMMATHAAIQSEVIGARTETARALQSWSIPVKGDIARARALDQLLEASGGTDVSGEMARRLAILGNEGADAAAIGRFAQAGSTASTVDAIKEAWINGLLSNPKTHLVNIASNTLVVAASIAERQVAGTIRALTGGDGVEMGEAAAQVFGLVSGLKDAFRLAAKAVNTGETGWTLNKVDLPATKAISANALGMASDTGLGRAVDYLGNAARVPSRLLGAEDEFFKAIGYRMELHAQAVRTAIQEGHTGYDLGKRVADLIKNPPENIMINSADAALYQTFTNATGSFAQGLMNLRNGGGPFNPIMFILPFIRTPANIARFAFERTPFAPLVSQWRADIAAGGARSDLALARMSTGTALMMTTMDMADKGMITGPMHAGTKDQATSEALQRQGVTPYSFKVGDKWYSYNRLDPFGMTMGFAASITEAVKKGELDNDQVDEWQEVAAMAIAAVSQVTIDKTYLQGTAQLIDAMSDPNRYAPKEIESMVASFVPLAGLNSGIKNMVDPTQREVNSPWEAVESHIAKLSSNLTPRRDLWGKPITNESGLGTVYDWLSPVGVKKEEATPIDREIVRLGSAPSRITKQTPFDGVQANLRFYPQVYDQYQKLAGNELKSPVWGMGAKDYLNSVVSGKHPMSAVYNTMSDESRKAFINSTIGDYRHLAQQQILGDPKNAAFAAEIQRLKDIQQASRMPMMQ